MAYDPEARSTGNSAVAFGLIAIVLVALVAGFMFMRPGIDNPSTTIVSAPASPPSSTTVVQPPAVNVQPPSVNINPAPAAPAPAESGSRGSDAGSSGSSE